MPRVATDGKAKRRAQAQALRNAARGARLSASRISISAPARSGHPRLSTLSGLKNYQDAKLTYTENVLMSSATGVAQYLFQANSLYDPNYSATGHQPAYFDQYMQFYTRYVVKKATIRVRPAQLNYGESVSGAPFYGVLLQGDTITTPGSINTMLENLRMDKRSTDAKLACTPAQRNDEGGRSSVYCNYDAIRDNAKTHIHELADSHKGTVSTSPSTKWWFQLLCCALDGSAFESTRFVVELTFYVRFHDRKIAPIS